MLDRGSSAASLPAYTSWAIGEENAYAHRKRLHFIIRAAEDFRTARRIPPEEVSVLDVGCGTGIMVTLPLASLGYQVTGIDIDRSSIETVRGINPYSNAMFRQAGAADLLAAGERYDVIIAAEVLEHIADPLTFLRTLRGLLTPRGILILTTPNGYGWFELEQFLWDDLGLGKGVLWWHERWAGFTQRLKAPIKRAIRWRPRPMLPAPPWEYLTSTKNAASPHVQRFRWSHLERVLALAGLGSVRHGKSSLFCGKFTHFYLRNQRWFIALNAAVSEVLPRAMAAGWYLVCQADASQPRLLCLSDSGLMAQAATHAKACFGVPPTELCSFRQLRQRPWHTLRLPFRRFDGAVAFLTDVNAPLYRDFIIAYLFTLRAGWRALQDTQGREVPIRRQEAVRAVARCLGDLVGLPVLYAYGRLTAQRFSRRHRHAWAISKAVRRAVYLRANLWQEASAGGSMAHTTGVLAGLKAAGIGVTYVGTTDFPHATRLGVRVCVVPPRLRWLRNLPDLPFLVYSEIFARRSRDLLAGHAPDFIYQRYSVLNYSGAQLARAFRCPLVLEYNGSEVWIARNWSTPLFFEGLANRIELANLKCADLVLVVSKTLQEEVIARGIPADRVLVNPNAVDPARFHPHIDGGPIRHRLGLGGKLVIGFIGTFGPWHGAEVLAQAVRPVAVRLPEAHVLFIGDGSGMPRVQEIIARDGVQGRVSLVGLIPQDEAPNYLAACDILVSPHVGNKDGSPFFGSPTKLFEYMAMGRGIVASDLDQIGEVLSHGKTAWLVKPGDPDTLAEGMMTLGTDAELRRALGEAAREEVVAKHTWKAHVERLLTKMVELNLLDPGALHPPAAR